MPQIKVTGAEFSFKGDVEVCFENTALELDKVAKQNHAEQTRYALGFLAPFIAQAVSFKEQPTIEPKPAKTRKRTGR